MLFEFHVELDGAIDKKKPADGALRILGSRASLATAR
jgi:hypothetical protein